MPTIWSCALTRQYALAPWEPMCRILCRLLASLARLWVPIIRSWALTRGFALRPGTSNRYMMRHTRTQHRPA